MNNLSYELRGLECADCAVKIEEHVRKLDGVVSAEVIFATQKLNVAIDAGTPPVEAENNIRHVVKSFEPDIELIEIGSRITESKDDKTGFYHELMQIAISALLLFSAVFLKLPFMLEITFYIAAYILSGHRVLLKAFRNIIKGQVFDENFLMTISTLGAMAIREFSEAVAVMLFFKAGELIQSLAVNKSRNSIKALLNIRPDFANLKTENGIERISPESVKPGDKIVIRPGERVPLDGIVIEGSSFADTSALTGEPVPRQIGYGDTILSGFINTTGVLTVTVQKSFRESTVSRILDLVQNAASKKAPTESFITRFARYYTPGVVGFAAVLAVFPPLLSGSMDFSSWIYRALIFLVISCPCALVISIPLSFFGGIGAASRKGILVKGGNYLEALNSINAIVFDKTGTLTKGVFKVSEVSGSKEFSEEDVIMYAAHAEANSTHPIARSILEAYRYDIDRSKLSDCFEIAGQGVRTSVEGKTVCAGTGRFLISEGCVNVPEVVAEGTIVQISVEGVYAGHISISDKLKDDSAAAIRAIRELGDIRIAMLTGDNEKSARQTAEKLKIDEFYYGLLPHEKVEMLQNIRETTHNPRLAFVGDGINDAPVLAIADIGIAMGGLGSDAAIESADIVLMTDEPYKIVDAVRIARKTRSIVWQNIILALVIKLLVLVLGAGGLATMWEAVFADVGVTVLAVFNSLRVLRN